MIPCDQSFQYHSIPLPGIYFYKQSKKATEWTEFLGKQKKLFYLLYPNSLHNTHLAFLLANTLQYSPISDYNNLFHSPDYESIEPSSMKYYHQ